MTSQLRTHAALAALLAASIAPVQLARAAEDGGTVSGVIALPAPDQRGEPEVLNTGFVPRARNPLKAPKAFDPLPMLVVALEGGPVDAADTKAPNKPVRYQIIGESFEIPLLPVVVGTKLEIENRGTGSPRLYAPGHADLLESDPINPKGVRPAAPIATALSLIEIRDHDSAHLRGRVVAFPNAYFSTVDDSGRFEIEGVPAGTWKVKIWYRDGWVELPESVTVDVPARRSARSVRIALPVNLETVIPGEG